MNYFGFILLNHFVGDFVFQSRMMGENKSKSMYWLSMHILTYTTCIAFLSFPFFSTVANFALWVIVNMVLHFCTDFVTSRLTGFFYLKADAVKKEIDELKNVNNIELKNLKLTERALKISILSKDVHKHMKAFWTTIGADQLIHGLCLYYTFLWLVI